MKTDRLAIRRFRQSDLADLDKLLSDEDVMRYIEPPYTREQTTVFLNTVALREPPILLAAETCEGQFIGYVIYHPYGENSYEIGWVLLKEHWGKGYADELTRALIDDAKEKTKYLIIECSPEQTVSKRIALKNGFTYVGFEDGRDLYQIELKR